MALAENIKLPPGGLMSTGNSGTTPNTSLASNFNKESRIKIPENERLPPKKPLSSSNYSVKPMQSTNASINQSSMPAVRSASEDELVSSQLSGLLSDESDYIKIAKREAAEAANERGMLNSSLAIGSATDAAIKAALPIAQQDAATNYQIQNNNQNTVNDFKRAEQTQQHTLEADEARAGLESEQNIQKSNLSKSELELQSRLVTEQNTSSNNDKVKLIETQAVADIEKQAQSIDANYRNGYLQSATTIVTGAQAEIANIYANTALTAEQQNNAVKSVTARRDADIKWLTSSADALKDWPLDRGAFSFGEPTSGPKPPTPIPGGIDVIGKYGSIGF